MNWYKTDHNIHIQMTDHETDEYAKRNNNRRNNRPYNNNYLQ